MRVVDGCSVYECHECWGGRVGEGVRRVMALCNDCIVCVGDLMGAGLSVNVCHL